MTWRIPLATFCKEHDNAEAFYGIVKFYKLVRLSTSDSIKEWAPDASTSSGANL
jgi:hypothetical protein